MKISFPKSTKVTMKPLMNQRRGELHIKIAPGGDQQMGRVFIRVTICKIWEPLYSGSCLWKAIRSGWENSWPGFLHMQLLFDASCGQIHTTKKCLIPRLRQENISPPPFHLNFLRKGARLLNETYHVQTPKSRPQSRDISPTIPLPVGSTNKDL